MLEIYKRIRARREELGISQEELAKRMGYRSRSSINKIENGEDKEKEKNARTHLLGCQREKQAEEIREREHRKEAPNDLLS